MTIDIEKFSECKILVIGDLMIDEYVWGNVDRISPEAPVQVVAVTREDYTIGGAGNVANNLVTLGAKVRAMGVIGKDAAGKLLQKKLKDLGVDATGVIAEPGRPTTIKTRIIAAHQHVLRIDRESRRSLSAKSHEKLLQLLETALPDIGVVLISDYGKGLFSEEFLKGIIAASRSRNIVTIVDPKGNQYARYAGASLVTPNLKEASQASGIEIYDTASLHQAGDILLDRSGIERILITLGKDGMILFEPGTKPLKISAEARQVFDVSGAGDTVVATLGIALAAGGSFGEAMTLANTAAGLVVAKVGTATVSREELRAALFPSTAETTRKQVLPEDLESLSKQLKKSGRRIVLTNGCFDLLHAGHVNLFSKAKKLGDVLIVAIDDDASVAKHKGAGRPVLNAGERLKLIGAIDSVDYVTVFTEDQLEAIIEAVQPDVLTKGSNYKQETVFGHEIVERLGGRVVLTPIRENISSSGIIEQIRTDRT